MRHKDTSLIGAAGKWLISMPHLEWLDLTWGLRDCVVEQNPEFVEVLQHILFTHKFSNLRMLHLRRFKSYFQSFVKFLRAHSDTLEYLHLSGDIISFTRKNSTRSDPTHRKLLTLFKTKFALKKLEYLPYQSDNSGSGESILSWCDPPGRIYDNGWQPLSEPETDTKAAKLLENFVIRGAPWPMAEDNPRTNGVWKRRAQPTRWELERVAKKS